MHMQIKKLKNVSVFRSMKIYTRKGDDGTTGLLGGLRVPKDHLRLDSYGTVDELNAHLGLLRDQCVDSEVRDLILHIQDRLFTIGSHLAVAPSHTGKMQLPEMKASDTEKLESTMDKMESGLPEMRNFVLPGGHPLVSQCHIARCVCRRAERLVVALHRVEPVSPQILTYLNRLSDLLFVLSRDLSRKLGVGEIRWKPS
jgi:cob(I)alamin adenosyltransferase